MNDWECLNIEEARRALYSCHMYPEDMDKLRKFFKDVELLKRKYVKQVPALLKEKPDEH